MRVLVTGSRDWEDRNRIIDTMTWLYGFASATTEGMTLVHGGARGADRLCDWWAQAAQKAGARITVESHAVNPNQYRLFGKQAPLLRNQKMVDLGADICVAYSRNQSKGTADCVARARAAGISVWFHIHGYPAPVAPSRFDLKLT